MDFIKGMDISTLIEERECGAKYFDKGEKKELLDILKSYGCNSVRLRLWNDPYSEDGRAYEAGTCDTEKLILLAKEAKQRDIGFLLDFHYSDFWADPGKQNVPKAWRGQNINELVASVYNYTRHVLNILFVNGLKPQMVQVGNEVTNGLLWPLGKKPWEGSEEGSYENIARLISSGIKAVRDFDSNIPVMIHLDNGGNNAMYVDWFDHYFANKGEDFEIIGLSYYPYWHGSFEELTYNMKDMHERYGKKICIAETSMGFSMEDYRKYEGLPPERLMGMATKPELVEKIKYPMTAEGQSAFMTELMERIAEIPEGIGFYYWEPGWVPVPGCGWASEAALEYTNEKGPGGNEWANQALFDYEGNSLPALETIKNFKA
ncbi:MAG: glycosyl hydrolase 53 family protein [Lachnospiraceae bacterium]|nr:glycosyl hydrolase 53 family protein [Lachnospiraceae bacterium]